MSENDCKVGPKRSRLLSFEYTADQVSNFSHSNRPGDENKIRIDANFPIKRSRCQCLHCRQQLTVSRQPWGLIYKTNPDLLTRETILCQYTGFWLSECQVCWTQNSSSWLALAWPGQRERVRDWPWLWLGPACPAHSSQSLSRHRPDTEIFCTGIQVLGGRIFMFRFNVYHPTLTHFRIILNDIGHGRHVITQ